jgi:hypothetical protein
MPFLELCGITNPGLPASPQSFRSIDQIRREGSSETIDVPQESGGNAIQFEILACGPGGEASRVTNLRLEAESID